LSPEVVTNAIQKLRSLPALTKAAALIRQRMGKQRSPD
jgi:hypothetical protein